MSINKNIRKIAQPKHQFTAEEIVLGIKQSSIKFLSLAITLVESNNKDDQIKARKIVDKCLPLSGNSMRIGITGVPGVGKSTFIEAFGNYMIEEKQKKVAVLAVDPTSTKSYGSILGDKTRMSVLAVNENAFIRPSPSMGTLGGVSRATRESIILCEAAGFDTLLIETVGVGQSETEVKGMVDFFLLLMLAGAGDELQGIKRGIMEMADFLVINKADGDNIENAKRAKREYKNALHLFPPSVSGWIPKVESCSAIEESNMDLIYNISLQYFEKIKSNSYFGKQRKDQNLEWFQKALKSQIIQYFMQDEHNKVLKANLEKEVIAEKISPFSAVEQLLSQLKK